MGLFTALGTIKELSLEEIDHGEKSYTSASSVELYQLCMANFTDHSRQR